MKSGTSDTSGNAKLMARREITTSLGRLLRRLRKQKNLSVGELSKASGLRRGRIRHIENGAGEQGPLFYEVKAILKALGLDLALIDSEGRVVERL